MGVPPLHSCATAVHMDLSPESKGMLWRVG